MGELHSLLVHLGQWQLAKPNMRMTVCCISPVPIHAGLLNNSGTEIVRSRRLKAIH